MSSQTEQRSQKSRGEFHKDSGEWQQDVERGTDRMRNMVSDNAGRSMLLALGAGLGVGILIGTAMGGSGRSSRGWGRSTAESLGKSLLNKLDALLPDAVNDRFNG